MLPLLKTSLWIHPSHLMRELSGTDSDQTNKVDCLRVRDTSIGAEACLIQLLRRLRAWIFAKLYNGDQQHHRTERLFCLPINWRSLARRLGHSLVWTPMVQRSLEKITSLKRSPKVHPQSAHRSQKRHLPISLKRDGLILLNGWSPEY